MGKMRYRENVIIKKGLFPASAKEIDEKFAFVSLDMDLFNPIFEGLEFFWPKMSPGGVIFVHDYDCWDGVTKAVMKFSSENNVGYICLNDGVTAVFSKAVE